MKGKMMAEQDFLRARFGHSESFKHGKIPACNGRGENGKNKHYIVGGIQSFKYKEGQ